MPHRPLAYLAGPDVFHPRARSLGRTLCELAESAGITAYYPLDGEIDPRAFTERSRMAAHIRRLNLDAIRRADLVLANMTPFRGPGMDGGTAYEMGFAEALGKPVFRYSTIPLAAYRERIRCRRVGGRLVCEEGLEVEDLELSDNLMMACVDEAPIYHGFAAALGAARAWLDERGA